MAKIYRQSCKYCGRYYEGQGRYFCSHKCANIFITNRIDVKNKQRKRMLGKNNPFWRGGLIKKICPTCENEFLIKRKRIDTAKFCSHKCKRLSKEQKTKIKETVKKLWCNDSYRRLNSGKNHYNWMDGKSFEPYPLEFNNQLKEKIRKRDGCICQKCGKTQKEELLELKKKLSIHHIDYDKNNYKEGNLITFCQSCNSKVNKKDQRCYWTNYFQNYRCLKIW